MIKSPLERVARGRADLAAGPGLATPEAPLASLAAVAEGPDVEERGAEAVLAAAGA